MNSMYRWSEIILLYIRSPHALALMVVTIIGLSALNTIALTIQNAIIQFIVGDVCFSLLLYFAMIATLVSVHTARLKSTRFLKHFWRVVRMSWWVIALKIAWNISNATIMGIEYLPDPTMGLFPSLMLLLSWLLILFLTSYVVPRAVVDYKTTTKFSLGYFLHYVLHAIIPLLTFTLFSIATVGFLLLTTTFMCSYVPPLLKNIVNPAAVKNIVEILLAICMQVWYAQLTAISALYVYMHHIPRNSRPTKIYSLD